jgi:hypothetical protein
VDLFQLQELGEVIGQELARPASLVTPENPSRPQTLETPGPAQTSKEEGSKMTTLQEPSSGALAPLMMIQDQPQQLLQQLYYPAMSSNPKVDDPEQYHGGRLKLHAFITQCKLKFNCEPNKFDSNVKRVNYTSLRCRGNAWLWIEPSIAQGQSMYKMWEEFKTAITRAFGEADSKEVVRRRFKAIRQGNRSAAAYWAEFQRSMADLDYNDSMYIDQFNDGLYIDI